MRIDILKQETDLQAVFKDTEWHPGDLEVWDAYM